MPKKISVISTVYNEPESWLARCFDSVTEQSDGRVELIIADDGSGPEAAAFCDRYAKRHSHCRVIHQDNRGVASARNAGLDACSGDYVMFLDADDRLAPGAIKALLPYVGTDAQMIICNVVTVREGVPAKSRVLPFADGTVLSRSQKKNLLLDILANGCSTPSCPVGMQTCWGKLYSLPFLRSNRIRFCENLRVAEDICFFADCVSRSRGSIIYADRTLYRRYINPRSLMNRFLPDIRRNDEYFIAELKRIVSGKISDVRMESAMNKRYCLCVFGICRYFICHRSNPMTDAEKAEMLRELAASEPYRTGIRQTPLRLMTRKNALKLLLLKLRMEPLFIRTTHH